MIGLGVLLINWLRPDSAQRRFELREAQFGNGLLPAPPCYVTVVDQAVALDAGEELRCLGADHAAIESQPGHHVVKRPFHVGLEVGVFDELE